LLLLFLVGETTTWGIHSFYSTFVNITQVNEEFYTYLRDLDPEVKPPKDGGPNRVSIALLSEAGTRRGQIVRQSIEKKKKEGRGQIVGQSIEEQDNEGRGPDACQNKRKQDVHRVQRVIAFRAAGPIVL